MLRGVLCFTCLSHAFARAKVEFGVEKQREVTTKSGRSRSVKETAKSRILVVVFLHHRVMLPGCEVRLVAAQWLPKRSGLSLLLGECTIVKARKFRSLRSQVFPGVLERGRAKRMHEKN